MEDKKKEGFLKKVFGGLDKKLKDKADSKKCCCCKMNDDRCCDD